MRRLSQFASIVPVIVAGTLACVPSAFAASAPPMSVTVQQPGVTGNYFEVSAQPGQTTSAGSLRVQNQTPKQITVMLDPVGGLTASTLGSAYGLRGSKASGPAKWVVLGQRRVVLGPRKAARVPVSVSVPSSAGPGEYLAGIGVQSGGGASQVRLEGSVAVSQVQRYAVGIVTSLPGPRHPKIKLTGVGLDREPAGVTFKIRGRNAGNVILQNVKGAATISEGDDVITRRELGPGTFVTGTSIAYPLLVSDLSPSQGTEYRVQAVMRYPGGVARIDEVVRFGEIDAKRQQSYGGPAVSNGDDGSNLWLILLIVALIGGCLAALAVRRRRLGSGEAALRRALPREIEHARASGEPLSVILVPAAARRPAELASTVRDRLRSRDRLFRLKDAGLMVVSPDTTPEAGEMLAAEIRRHLARGGNGAAVIPVTSAAESSAEELLEAAAAAGSDAGLPANGDAGNGTGNEDRADQSSQSEVKPNGTEAPAVGGRDGTQRR